MPSTGQRKEKNFKPACKWNGGKKSKRTNGQNQMEHTKRIELERVKAKQRRLESNFVFAFTMAWNGAHQQLHGANIKKNWNE